MRYHTPQDGLHSLYPPRLVDSIDVTEQTENDITRYVIRNTATSRYFRLKGPEYLIFRQIDGTQTPAQIARGGRAGDGPQVSLAALIRFLGKLDSFGLLARAGEGSAEAEQKPRRGLYLRIHLFNPNRLLAWMDRCLGWAFTRPLIIASFVMMALVALGLIVRADEVARHTSYIYSEYGLAAILTFTFVITALHEFAHGLACKHFGGEVREVGVLMIYYVLPAFYCNVSDIYRLGRRRERLWVILAGIYWQLMVSAAAAALWLIATPYTFISDFMFLTFLGGTLNIIFNCNPLIKLDGYYALSQWLRIENLQKRSTDYVRAMVSRLVDGKSRGSSSDADRPSLFLFYWLGSLVYSIVLIWLIVGWAGERLMSAMGLVGVILTIALAALLTEKWWRPAIEAIAKAAGRIRATGEGGNVMSEQAMEKQTEKSEQSRWTRRRIIKISVAAALLAALFVPWEASTGSDCALLLPPGRENVVRANTDAVLTEIYVQPGDAVSEGAKLARLANPEIEDRLTQLESEIERLTANASRIEDELGVRSETLLSASFREQERKRLAGELKAESKQIAEAAGDYASKPLPASLFVLQSEVELKQTEMEHNRREVERYKKLNEQGLIGEQIYDRAVAAMKVSEKELQSARARLEAAMVEHRREATSVETSSLVAETDARAARSSFEALIAELHSNREQLESLRQRREILRREYEGMNIVAARAGVILGDELHKAAGRRYGRGEEICRIGELQTFLLRVEVSEREIADVRLDSQVRFKLKTVPGRTFTGRVSKISAEPVVNAQGQRFYPVEAMVENSDGILRPGMTGFARISFGRRSIGLIIGEKIWQALRPELWLF
ncbi:MAG: efflux RND transporter periplasmic adaptor subunit [Acidobacteriota bacterium]